MQTPWISYCAALLCVSGATLSAPQSTLAQAKKPAKPVAKPKSTTKPTAKPASKTPAKPKPTPRPTPKAAPLVVPTPTPQAAPVVVVPTPTPTPEVGPRTFALLVGVGKYQSLGVPALKYPPIDAASLRDALIDPQLGGIPAERVKLLADDDATRDNILGAVDTFFKPNVQEGDRVIVFLAGHGVSKGVGIEAKSYLLPTDVKGLTTAAFESSAVNLKTLSEKLSELPAGQFMMFVDACREDPTPSRAAKGSALTDIMTRSVQVVPKRTADSATFFACSLGQRAFEDPRLKHGVFTYYILKGLSDPQLPKPGGVVDMGYLADYVSENVEIWAKKVSEEGDYEVDQSPEIIAGELSQSVQVIRVKGVQSTSTQTPTNIRTRLNIVTIPEGGQVTINGERIGPAPRLKDYPAGGEFQIKVELSGYEPVQKTVKLLDGYGHQVTIPLTASRGVGASVANPAATMSNEMFQKGLDAEARQQWEVAQLAYSSVMQGDAKFAPAYERLSSLQTRRGDLPGAITTLNKMTTQLPVLHSWSLLSRAYAEFAIKAKAEADPATKKSAARINPRVFLPPKTGEEAALYAREAARRALQLDANSADANLAAGFASVVSDEGEGKNKNEAMGYFGKAVLADDKDASTHYGMGFGIRYFAQFLPNEAAQKPEVERARASLQQAIAMRPDFYEAHRELAYCAHLLKENQTALKEYQMANSLRGEASDADEVAGLDVAMSTLHKEEAQKSTGEKRA
ncbi:MAG: hypothetical protein JWN98_1688, partial [Abditibacteriota bacterium]|nr:hypothetical protein [Abditibacteriota bacterium]